MAKRVGVDKFLFCATLVLVVIGLLMVFSASAVLSKVRYGSPYTFLIRQSIFACLGLAAMTVLMQIDYRKLNRTNVIFPLVGVTVITLLSAFLMRDSHNTHRWIRFGVFSFQPSALATPVAVLFIAWFLQNRMHAMDDLRNTILPAALPSLIFTGLILKEPDLGTAMVVAAVTALLLYVAGMRLRWIVAAFVASAPILYWMLFRVAWRRERLLAFLNPEADPLGKGFHIIQSLIAVGTGGLYGLGYMEGRQKLFFLPEPQTDYIFANISEELGFIGAIVIVGLFVYIGYRGFRAAILSRDPFARFVAFGLTSAILIQAFFNISVVIDLLPTKGITLPFISYGGTSLIIMLCCMGILLSITREVE
ncbi:MAG: putative lipid II flippase FtsW [Acidobacteria bacterium]|nr:putative lipid II flippase FtsW [Acidobacteriota bacterium]